MDLRLTSAWSKKGVTPIFTNVKRSENYTIIAIISKN